MAKQLSSSSSCVRIVVGSSASSSTETSSNLTVTTNDDSSLTEKEIFNVVSECSYSDQRDTMEDVLPVYILQPKEISKNTDLMKTVAMLMESKLEQPLRGTDSEKMRDLYSDIQRFPEAYQKFTSIIHQIQYLNVTNNWDYTMVDGEDSKTNIITKLLQVSKCSSEKVVPEDLRKRVMLNLLNELLRVFNRYQAIQVKLEERLRAFADLIVKTSIQLNNHKETESNTPVVTTEYSDEDDPQQPLLTRAGQGESGLSERKMYTVMMEKAEVLAEILRKTRRQATEVQDSIEVMKDLINWDHKQTNSARQREECTSSLESCQQSTNTFPEVVVNQRSHQQGNCNTEMMNGGPDRKVWIIAVVVVTLLVLLLVLTAAFSFLRFNY